MREIGASKFPAPVSPRQIVTANLSRFAESTTSSPGVLVEGVMHDNGAWSQNINGTVGGTISLIHLISHYTFPNNTHASSRRRALAVAAPARRAVAVAAAVADAARRSLRENNASRASNVSETGSGSGSGSWFEPAPFPLGDAVVQGNTTLRSLGSPALSARADWLRVLVAASGVQAAHVRVAQLRQSLLFSALLPAMLLRFNRSAPAAAAPSLYPAQRNASNGTAPPPTPTERARQGVARSLAEAFRLHSNGSLYAYPRSKEPRRANLSARLPACPLVLGPIMHPAGYNVILQWRAV